jgi:hypothetical protein
LRALEVTVQAAQYQLLVGQVERIDPLHLGMREDVSYVQSNSSIGMLSTQLPYLTVKVRIGAVSAPQRYVASAWSGFTKVPEVADHRNTGLTPYEALVVEVNATSLPAAFLYGVIV